MSRCAVCFQKLPEGTNPFWDETRGKTLFRHDKCAKDDYKTKSDMESMSETVRMGLVKNAKEVQKSD